MFIVGTRSVPIPRDGCRVSPADARFPYLPRGDAVMPSEIACEMALISDPDLGHHLFDIQERPLEQHSGAIQPKAAQVGDRRHPGLLPEQMAEPGHGESNG
jgi:hypothetical protein